MKFEDLKFIAIGGYCMSVYALGADRIRGPVDNTLIISPKIVELLLTGKYFNYIKTTEPKRFLEQDIIKFNFEDNIIIGHNNFDDSNYLKELEIRCNNLNTFLINIKNSETYYLTFAVPYRFIDKKTHKLLDKRWDEVIKILAKYNLLDKTIFIFAQKSKAVKKDVWYDVYITDDELNYYQKKYNLKIIKLTELNFGLENGKAAVYPQFCKLVSELIFRKE